MSLEMENEKRHKIASHFNDTKIKSLTQIMCPRSKRKHEYNGMSLRSETLFHHWTFEHFCKRIGND